jgi:hypothetical protein
VQFIDELQPRGLKRVSRLGRWDISLFVSWSVACDCFHARGERGAEMKALSVHVSCVLVLGKRESNLLLSISAMTML